jgi:hypothetical protein
MTLVERATREVAQNKLLYSAIITLPEVGRWGLEVTIKQGNEAASVRKQCRRRRQGRSCSPIGEVR